MTKFEDMDENQKNMVHKMIEMITRQTSYDYEEAKAKIIEHDFDFAKVIREFMGIKPKNNEDNKIVKNVNQQIYTEIRGLMDTAASSFRYQQEVNEARVKHIEKQKYDREQELKEKESKDPIINTNECNDE
jgi:hypothetical protein